MTRRKMSSPAEKPAELTTDEKAAEIGKEAVPWFRKHALWLVPSTIFCVVSTDIIINPDHRETLEKYMPDYVDFVRKQYGFDDEDLDEWTRVNYVQYVHSQPLDLVIKFSNRPDLRISNVDGSQQISSLESLIKSKLCEENADGSGSADSGQNFNIINGSYNNANMEDVYFEDASSPDLAALASSHKHQYRHARMVPSVEMTANEASDKDLHPSESVPDSGSDGCARLALGDPFCKSRWNDYPPMDLKSATRSYVYDSGSEKSTAVGFDMTTLGLRGKSENSSSSSYSKVTTPGVGVDRRVLDVPFFNFMKSAADGMNTYRKFGNHEKMKLLRILPAIDNGKHKRVSSKSNTGKKDSSATVKVLANQRRQAMEAVEQRKRKIKEWEVEMRSNSTGGREIDTISADIAQARSEIGQIQRKYLNYFYFF